MDRGWEREVRREIESERERDGRSDDVHVILIFTYAFDEIGKGDFLSLYLFVNPREEKKKGRKKRKKKKYIH